MRHNLAQIAESLARLEKLLSQHLAAPTAEQLECHQCWRWEVTPFGGRLTPLTATTAPLTQLIGLQEQIKPLEQNTKLFLQGKPANHALLTGPRGCGKSSVVRGLFGKYARRGLRLIEVEASGLAQLPVLAALLTKRLEKFILYCDDLSFPNANHPSFGRLKSVIDGGISTASGNLLLYATSNRRNIVAENYGDNLPTNDNAQDIQPLETLDEKIALADRFGLWVPFFAPTPDEYDALVTHWLQLSGVTPSASLMMQGRQFADMRGSRNGRIARQFAIAAAGLTL